MKKIFNFAIFVLAALALTTIVTVSYAAAPANTDQVFESKLDTTVATIDTIAAVDSQTIVASWYPKERNWSYYLINKTITGGGSDSVYLYIWGYSYNSSGTLLNKQFIDSIIVANPTPIAIPINLKMTGSTFTIKAIGITSKNGGEVITNGWQLVKYRPANWNK